MGSWDWQLAIALACVGIATAVLVRRALRILTRKSPGCGTACQTCPSGGADRSVPREKPFVALDRLHPPKENP